MTPGRVEGGRRSWRVAGSSVAAGHRRTVRRGDVRAQLQIRTRRLTLVEVEVNRIGSAVPPKAVITVIRIRFTVPPSPSRQHGMPCIVGFKPDS